MKLVQSLFLCITLPLFLSGCSYIKYSKIQAEYARIQNAEPGQVNLKHMIDHETFFAFGKTIDDEQLYLDTNMAIAAYSNRFKENERVDTMFFSGSGTHYGLNLPEGSYSFVVYADKNGDALFDSQEAIGRKEVIISLTEAKEKIVGHLDIPLSNSIDLTWQDQIKQPKIASPKKSLFYPAGSIRKLDDPVFDARIATLGMYDPASFLEQAPTMFYTLEEDHAHKIPVVFVHGINGSAREFKTMVENLDLKRYKPLFFYYPSGGDLTQLAELFYRIFLSGTVIPLQDMPMAIVSHSMGGVIVREALNRYQESESENKVKLWITLATPFGGHPAAALGEKGGKYGLLVLPAWRDLNPENEFIQTLYRKPLPKLLSHHLLYAFDNVKTIKVGENSDGIVPLSSQLHLPAQRQSDKQFGFKSTHTGILSNSDALDYVVYELEQLKNIYPESHLKWLDLGGYDVALDDGYSPYAKYYIKHIGRYLVALARGYIDPITEVQGHFVAVVKKQEEARDQVEKDLLRFMATHPDLVGQ